MIKELNLGKGSFQTSLVLILLVPNTGHIKIAEIMKKKEGSHLITQNVDNLHQNSGIQEKQITELHGNATYASCLDCNKRYELIDLKQDFLITKEPPFLQ